MISGLIALAVLVGILAGWTLSRDHHYERGRRDERLTSAWEPARPARHRAPPRSAARPHRRPPADLVYQITSGAERDPRYLAASWTDI